MHEAEIYKNFTVAQVCQKILFVFEKAIIQYHVQNSKSLIAMLSYKNSVNIISTKAIF